MKNTLLNKLTLSVIYIIFTIASATAQIPELTVIYPKPGQTIAAVDSTFIFGHLPENLPYKAEDILIKVNGFDFDVHPGGGFLAFVPVIPGDFTFVLDAYLKKELKKPMSHGYPDPVAIATIDVVVPEPLKSLPADTLQILGDYNRPLGNLVLFPGSQLEVYFQGTPGMVGWFSIAGVVDSVPMAETAPRLQPYWGETLFGQGSVPDTFLIRGIYSGFYRVPESVSVKDATITYHLGPDKQKLIDSLTSPLLSFNIYQIHKILTCWHAITATSGYKVTLNPPDYPFTVRFTDSVQIIRHGPRKGYFSIFQPEGVEALVVGAEGDWYIAQLSPSNYAWIYNQAVERLPAGLMPPGSYLSTIRTYAGEDKTLVEFPLSGKHPFRIIEDDNRTLRVQLFGVTSNTDWIRYDTRDNLIKIATWSQVEPDFYELKIELYNDIWGYDTYYKGNTFYLQFNKAPEETWRLKNKTIVIDPGHSHDPGAIGPTGYIEADANLEIALVLRDMLKSAGARVIMTRDDNRNVALYDRPVIAKAADADLFVSVHNNALPDGVNPFENYGVSTYYYHPHSIELARAVQQEMKKETGLPDYGLYHGNLAINRPTQYPAILVECTFMILPEQEARLKTYQFRKKAARAIVRGIEDFLKEYDRGQQ
ncbi:MAG: N-acetylmuramoyl-L-alanine amidase family protein [Candidatus Zixiibacteriota bacterium]